jgi:hypothetical protein
MTTMIAMMVYAMISRVISIIGKPSQAIGYRFSCFRLIAIAKPIYTRGGMITPIEAYFV